MTVAGGVPVDCLGGESVEPPDLTLADAAKIAKALGHPIRLRILELFCIRCPRTAGDIAAEFSLAQSTISNHLRILREAGVIRSVLSGTRTWHCLNRSVISAYADAILGFAGRVDGIRGPSTQPI